MTIENPFVSISCITYNQAPYIRQCLDGFIMQKTNFPFEVLIHDDASTDGTEEIIREYEAKYPGLIKPLYEKENQWVKGRRGSAVFNFPRARGKYIALCEGDDYWTDPLKLQKQVDFLEENPEYGLVYTDKIEVDKNNLQINKRPFYEIQVKRYSSGEVFFDLLKGNFINTFTVLIRKDKLPIFDYTYSKFYYDWYYWLYVSINSKVYFLNEKTGAYRIHKEGYIQSLKNNSQAIKAHNEKKIHIKFSILVYLPYSYKFKIKKKDYFLAIREYIKILIINSDLNGCEKKKLIKSFLHFIVKYKKSLVSK